MRTLRNVMISLRDECKQSTYTTWRPGARRVGSKNPGPPLLSSSPLTSSSFQTSSSELSYGISLSEDSSELIFAKYSLALCTLNSNKMENDAFALHNCDRKNNLNDIVLHTNCPDWVSLIYLSQKNTRFFFLTAKMASLSIDHRRSKFKGKNCKELMLNVPAD